MKKITTQTQVSAGGIAFRKNGDRFEVALISVGEKRRWQLPKGLVNPGETRELAAVREVREEAGIETDLLDLIDKIEYWYFSGSPGKTVRFHKFVYFYLLKYRLGDVSNHDFEVNEAAWVGIEEAYRILTYESEKKVLKQAEQLIYALAQ